MIALALAGAVTGAGVATSRRAVDPVCTKITVIIKDSLERQYVSIGELREQLHQAGLWKIGQPMSHISCQQIEQRLLSHPMIRRVECYKLG